MAGVEGSGDPGASIDWAALRAAAARATRGAYAPYSRFPVGAAGLVGDGRVVTGCNVENASYGLTLCAECGVVSGMHATGGGRLVALSCVDASGRPVMCCGRCRQLLWEHGGPACLIDTPTGPAPLRDLLPYPFEFPPPVTDPPAAEPLSAAGPSSAAGPLPDRLSSPRPASGGEPGAGSTAP